MRIGCAAFSPARATTTGSSASFGTSSCSPNHSLLKDPPFSRLDLVSCRNLLIYLDRELQQQVLSHFHYGLNPGGFLFLGSSETADQPDGLFRADRQRKRASTSPPRRSADTRAAALQICSAATLPARIGVPLTFRALGCTFRTGSRVCRVIARRWNKDRAAQHSGGRRARAVHLSENAGRFLQPSGGP